MAVNEVDLSVKGGEITAIIGPNGAGKTTFFNLLTGFLQPDSGEIIFYGKKITSWKPHQVCRVGIARSFQIVNIFPKLTVLKSIQIAIFSREKKALRFFSFAKGVAKEEAFEILESVGLAEKAETLGGELSQGDQKRLEIGIALANRPKLLLLDEPTAGMSSLEKGSVIELIKDFSNKEDFSILLTEHDMDVVFNIAEKIWVLHNGSIIFHGNQEEVKNSEIVRKVYLGEETK